MPPEASYTLGSLKFESVVFLFARLLQKNTNTEDRLWWQAHSADEHEAEVVLLLIEVARHLESGDRKAAQTAMAEAGLRLAYMAAQAELLTEDLLPPAARTVPSMADAVGIERRRTPEDPGRPEFFGGD